MSLEKLTRDLIGYSPLKNIPEPMRTDEVVPEISKGVSNVAAYGDLSEIFYRELDFLGFVSTDRGLVKTVGETVRVGEEFLRVNDSLDKTRRIISRLNRRARREESEGKTPYSFALSVVNFFQTKLFADHRDVVRELFGRRSDSLVMDNNYMAGMNDYRTGRHTPKGKELVEIFNEKAFNI